MHIKGKIINWTSVFWFAAITIDNKRCEMFSFEEIFKFLYEFSPTVIEINFGWSRENKPFSGVILKFLFGWNLINCFVKINDWGVFYRSLGVVVMLFKKLLKFDKIIRVGIKISNLLILGKAIMVDSKIYFIDMK